MHTLTSTIPRPVRAPLPGRWIDLLRDGDTAGRYQSRSEAVMAYMCAAANTGATWPDIHHDLTDPSNTLASWALTRANGTHRTTRDTTRRLHSTWVRAKARVAGNPPTRDATDAHHLIGEIRATILEHDWRGAAGRRDRVVLEILLDMATTRGTVTPQVSIRALCERSPYRSARTCSSAVNSLARAGWIRIRRDSTRTSASVYTLERPPTLEGGQNLHKRSSQLPREAPVQKMPTPTAHPGSALELRDLGLVLTPTAAVIVGALTDDPASARVISSRCGAARRTVDGWLPRLARLGLAREPVPGGGWVRGDTDPGVVAMGLDVLDVESARVARHEGERVRWRAQSEARERAWLEGRARARGAVSAATLRPAGESPPSGR